MNTVPFPLRGTQQTEKTSDELLPRARATALSKRGAIFHRNRSNIANYSFTPLLLFTLLNDRDAVNSVCCLLSRLSTSGTGVLG